MKKSVIDDRKVFPGRIIIIGNGAAGMEAARTIRSKNSEAEILIFTEEAHPFYSRINLSTFIGEEMNKEKLFIYPPVWYDQHHISVRYETPVVGIFPEKNEVLDSEGRHHSYDALIIAAGSHPLLPPITGGDKEGVFTLRTMADALNIRKYARHSRQAVIIGGGILGIEAASSLSRLGLRASVVEIAGHIMPLQLDKEGAGVLQHILENRGIRFFTGSRAEEFTGDKKVSGIRLKSGLEIPADMVLISAGIIPNIRLAEKSGIRVHRGIVVNERLQTNYPNIFAAGDVAEIQSQIYGIWPAAIEQGAVAGSNATGIPAIYGGTMPLHILKVAGMDVTTLGQKYASTPDQKEIVLMNKEAGEYVKLVHDGRYLLGAVVLEVRGLSFRLKKLIERKTEVTEILPDLEKGDFEVLKRKR